MSKIEYYRTLATHWAATTGVLVAFLLLGTIGYHGFGGLEWVDAFLDASMILTGMGPVHQMQTTGGKLFAAFYALLSGVVFLTLVSVLLAPVIHKLVHRLHMDLEQDEG